MTARILIIEDDEAILAFLRRGLAYDGYEVETAETGQKGLALASGNRPDLIVLDWMLPGMDGLEVCKRLRTGGKIPILMLTAKDSVSDRVMGLDAGADDYMVKPFNLDELLARIRALLRRGRDVPLRLLHVGDLTVDLFEHLVTRNGQELQLTAREYEVLEYLARNADRVVTRTELSEHVWAGDFDSFSNVIDVFLYRLRQKVDQGHAHKLLHTARGAGYVLKSPRQAG